MKRLKRENLELKRTIENLRSGDHDIKLSGDSQVDMMWLLNQCQKTLKDRVLKEQFQNQDPSGTLELFWREQIERKSDPNKRKRWNPIVLRFMLHLWQKLGEKHFRILEEEKVIKLHDVF